jgi:DNA-3-methyladenine glycosylase II
MTMPNPAPTKRKRAPHAHAVTALKRCDEKLATIIAQVGPYRPTPAGDGFAALVRAIVNQQVSKYAGDAILGRLHALFEDGVPDAAKLRRITPRKLQSVGLSKRKVEYLRDLAAHVIDGRLVFEELADLHDEAIIERLTAIKGIGRWTAEMYLLFTLGRPDVLPLGDVALVNVVREMYGLPPEADAEHFGVIAEAWRPWRGIACWYLYRSINEQRAAARAIKAAARGK